MIRKLKSQLGYRWHLQKRHHMHWRVERVDGKAGFGALGDWRAVTFFKRYFLEAGVPVRIRRGWHSADATGAMQRLTRRFGLAVALPELNCDSAVVPGVEIDWPSLVEMTVELPADWASYCDSLRNSGRRDLRRFRKSNLRIVTGKRLAGERLRQFYDEHYLPSMVAMHGDDAYIHSLESVVELIDRGARFVEIWDDAQWLGGGMLRVDGDVAYFCRIGWRRGDAELRRTGIVSAIYIAVLKHAIESGCAKFRMGGVAPFFEDGLFFYKSKWGGRLDINRTFPSWRAWVDPSHPSVRWFFERNSLILPNQPKGRFDVCGDVPMADIPLARHFSDDLGSWLSPSELPSGSPKSDAGRLAA